MRDVRRKVHMGTFVPSVYILQVSNVHSFPVSINKIYLHYSNRVLHLCRKKLRACTYVATAYSTRWHIRGETARSDDTEVMEALDRRL